MRERREGEELKRQKRDVMGREKEGSNGKRRAEGKCSGILKER